MLYTHPKYKDKVVLPYTERFHTKTELKERIRDGTINGFVTLVGGRERPSGTGVGESEAGAKFGYCVQSYEPKSSDISPLTKKQIAEYYGFTDEEQVNRYIKKLPARTLNSTTFHTPETVSTSYLRWLMVERNFDDFEITHFIRYHFSDDSKLFLEPLLQQRHRYKLEGNRTAAECVKLICNGGFGYFFNSYTYSINFREFTELSFSNF